MYNVSDDYKAKILEPIQSRRIDGAVAGYLYTEKDILKGSFRYSNKCVGGSSIHLGGVYVGELNVTLLKSITNKVGRGEWIGQTINAMVGLLLDNGNWEGVPVGDFTIQEANWGKSGLEITAYDNMFKFDKAADFNVTSGSIYALLNFCCTKCGVTLGMTEDEVKALTNGDKTVGLYPVNDIETYRDIISWLAVTTCCFATINREGKLVLRHFGNSSGLTLDENHRKNGCTFSDFNTYYSFITVENIEEETISTYKGTTTTGLTMNIGANPFLQYGLDITQMTMRQNIIDKLAEFKYTPFKCSSFHDIAIDLGDEITFTGMTAGQSCKGCVMSIDYSFSGGVNMQGYGENPRLADVSSKADKESAANNSKMKVDTISWLVYENVTEIAVTQHTRISSLRFNVAREADADVWIETKLNTFFAADSSKIKAIITYLLDGEELTYKPAETWNIDDEHTLHYGYHFSKVSFDITHQLDVFLDIEGGTAVIAPECSKIVLSALGLIEQKEWDGNIEAEDEFSITFDTDYAVPDFIVTADAQLVEVVTQSFTDEYNITFDTDYDVRFRGKAEVKGQSEMYIRVTEDGAERITEDGASLRLTEYGDETWAESEDD